MTPKTSSTVEVVREQAPIYRLNTSPFVDQRKKMIIRPIPSIAFDKCHPERCNHGICIASGACPHRAFFQEQPYDLPMHNASMCVGCGSCAGACPLKAIRMI